MQQFGAKCETTLKLNSICELWNDVCAIFVHDARFQTGIPVWLNEVQLPSPKWFLHYCVKHKQSVLSMNFLGLGSQWYS